MIAMWLVWIITGLFVFLLVIRFLPSTVRIAAYIVIGALVVAQLVATIYTMTVDPQDSLVLKANVGRNVDYVKLVGVPVIEPESRLCNICMVKVGPATKHCK
ncbi:hypothetical protein HK097_007998, partial [Rhizophlyctis rosea]